MSVLEAWAYGKPVFMTQACNLAEGFSVGAAFRITTDPEDIAATLTKTLPDTTRLRSVGQAGRALVETSFNWAEICESWLSLYSAISRSNADQHVEFSSSKIGKGDSIDLINRDA